MAIANHKEDKIMNEKSEFGRNSAIVMRTEFDGRIWEEKKEKKEEDPASSSPKRKRKRPESQSIPEEETSRKSQEEAPCERMIRPVGSIAAGRRRTRMTKNSINSQRNRIQSWLTRSST